MKFQQPHFAIVAALLLLPLTAGRAQAADSADAPRPALNVKPAKPAAGKKAPPKAAAPAGPARHGQRPPATPPSIEQIRTLYEQQKYPEVLKAVSQALAARPGGSAGGAGEHEPGEAAAAGEDDPAAAADAKAYELWLLKAETHLRMKAPRPAAEAFEKAGAAAPDAQTQAQATATALLVRRSNANRVRYKPSRAATAAAAEVFDLLDTGQRPAALAALYAEESAAAAPDLKAARSARSLPTVFKAIERLRDLRALELAATGGEAESSAAAAEMAEWAVELMRHAVEAYEKRVARIEERANELIAHQALIVNPNVSDSAGYEYTYSKRGLERVERRVLGEAADTCRRIVPTAAALAEASEAEGLADDLRDLRLRAAHVGRLARQTLNANYSRNPYGGAAQRDRLVDRLPPGDRDGGRGRRVLNGGRR